MMKMKEELCLLVASPGIIPPTIGNAAGTDFHDWS
jgi:hypothetical protein